MVHTTWQQALKGLGRGWRGYCEVRGEGWEGEGEKEMEVGKGKTWEENRRIGYGSVIRLEKGEKGKDGKR